jgi:hypothetical protein
MLTQIKAKIPHFNHSKNPELISIYFEALNRGKLALSDGKFKTKQNN